jgi:hypothetical protein
MNTNPSLEANFFLIVLTSHFYRALIKITAKVEILVILLKPYFGRCKKVQIRLEKFRIRKNLPNLDQPAELVRLKNDCLGSVPYVNVRDSPGTGDWR